MTSSVHAYILIQTEVGKAAAVAAAIAALPGVTSAEDVTGPYDVIVRAEAELGRRAGQAGRRQRAGRRRDHPHADLPGRPPVTADLCSRRTAPIDRTTRRAALTATAVALPFAVVLALGAWAGPSVHVRGQGGLAAAGVGRAGALRTRHGRALHAGVGGASGPCSMAHNPPASCHQQVPVGGVGRSGRRAALRGRPPGGLVPGSSAEVAGDRLVCLAGRADGKKAIVVHGRSTGRSTSRSPCPRAPIPVRSCRCCRTAIGKALPTPVCYVQDAIADQPDAAAVHPSARPRPFERRDPTSY